MSEGRFSHRANGTPESAWTSMVEGVQPLAPPGRADHLVVVAAHPDDETLGAGGLIALASAAGAKLTVIVATDGDASHSDSPTHSPADLAHRRRREVYAAVATLAPDAQVHMLGRPDGQLAAQVSELAKEIASIAGGCTHLVTPWLGDRHPDHQACAQAAAQANVVARGRHWQYPIWAWHWAEPDDPELPAGRQLRGVRLGPAAAAAKARALDCHISQHQPLSAAPGDEAILSATVLEHFRRDVEVFVIASAADAIGPEYFEALYTRTDDPWGLDERFYERRKRAALLAALTRPRFCAAFEPGCATGLLTAELAARCDRVLAWDVAGSAIEQTAARLGDAGHVSIGLGRIPDDWPDESFDLIVLSEVGYYCQDLAQLAARVDASLTSDGVLVACHWRHHAPLHAHSAEAVHAVLGNGHNVVVNHIEDDFVLQVWTRTGVSVAVADGIVK